MAKSYMRKSKKGRGLVDLKALTTQLIESVKTVDSWNKDGINEYHPCVDISFKKPKLSAHTPSVKTKLYKRIAAHIKTELHDHKSKKPDNKLALSTYHKYLTTARSAVRAAGLSHNMLKANIKKLVAKYPDFTSELNSIPDSIPLVARHEKKKVLALLLEQNTPEADALYNELIKVAVEHQVISFLVKSDSQTKKRMNNIKENLDSRKKAVFNVVYSRIAAVINHCLSSSEMSKLAFGAALASGRRSIEVVHCGTFEAVGEHSIRFTGQAKRGYGVIAKPYTFPTVIKAERIVAAVEKLRASDQYKEMMASINPELLPQQINAKINTKTARSFNLVAKIMLDDKAKRNKQGNVVSDRTFKDSRAIAGTIALEKIFKVKEEYKNIDAQVFLKRFFGHDQYKEQANYSHLKIDFKKGSSFSPAKACAKPAQAKKPKKIVKPSNDLDISPLYDADIAIEKTGNAALSNLHERVKKLAAVTGMKLTQTFIYKGKKFNGKIEKAGSSLVVVKRYLALPAVKAAVAKYNKGL